MPTILHDLLCTQCGYNLRGLPTLSRCPECGAPIVLTRENPLDPKSLRSIRLGCLLLAAALALSFLLAALANILPHFHSLFSLLPAFLAIYLPLVVFISLTIAEAALLAFATWKITTELHPWPNPVVCSSARFLAILHLLSILLSQAFLFLNLFSSISSYILNNSLCACTAFLLQVLLSVTLGLRLIELAELADRPSIKLQFQLLLLYFGTGLPLILSLIAHRKLESDTLLFRFVLTLIDLPLLHAGVLTFLLAPSILTLSAHRKHAPSFLGRFRPVPPKDELRT